jgi:L,D-transpeptidase YcbB
VTREAKLTRVFEDIDLMRFVSKFRVSFAVLAIATCVSLQSYPVAAEPDDVPWDEIDRVLKEQSSEPSADADAIVPGSDGSSEPDGVAVEPRGEPSDDMLAERPAPVPRPMDNAPTLPAPAATLESTPVDRADSESTEPPAADAAKPAPVQQAQAAAPEQPFDDPGDDDRPNLKSEAYGPPVPANLNAKPKATATYNPETFYLPLQNFFAAKSAVALADFNRLDRNALAVFYEQRLGEPMWVTKSGLNERAKSLLKVFETAADFGLSPQAFPAPNLARIGNGAFTEDDLMEAEAKLSLTAMTYARHARGDRIVNPTEQLSSYIDRKPNIIERSALLKNLASAENPADYLQGTNPRHPQFEALRAELLNLRSEKDAKFKPDPIPGGPKITPGKSHAHVALIRKRLNVASPGMKPNGQAADDTFYDETLARAVKRYKAEVGLPETATIDGGLRKAMNKVEDISESLLLANMEQWRWMPEDLGDTHIQVNIPEFMVRVIKDGEIIHAERVITGQTNTQTPVFSDMMRTVVFQPTWTVPESIKINELLPRLRAGGNPIHGRGLIMKRNGREVSPWEVDWFRRDIRAYDVIQPPGESNVLGVVKFMFPNKHSVYLHDTSSKSLFNSAVRTFSHGCVRVRNPVLLAEVLMGIDKGWDKRKVKDLIGYGPENNDVALERPVRVHITYFTAVADETGKIHRFADVYGHERRVNLALAGRFDDIDKGRDHLAPVQVPVASRRDYYSDSYGDDGYYYSRPRRANRQTYYYPPYGRVQQKKKPSGPSFFEQLFGAN